MANTTRILVRLQLRGVSELASFTQCILDKFRYTKGVGQLHCQLKDNFLILSDTQLTKDDQVELKHPTFCPIHHLTSDIKQSLAPEILDRGVDVGVAILLESCDGKILLSRRAQHLRIFPGLWVPPGGHVEAGETLMEAGLRELKEETGLHLQPKDCVDNKIHLLALWESVYPPKLSAGPPKRHHIVVYFHAKLVPGLTADLMEDHINFDPSEVGACAWLDRDMVSAIAKTFDEDCTEVVPPGHLPSVFRALTLDSENKQCISELPFETLLRVHADSDGQGDSERVSTGTKFALQHYLKISS